MRVVYVFEPHRAGLEILEKEGIDYTYYSGLIAPREWLEKELPDALVVVVNPAFTVNREVLDLAKSAKLIMIYGSGVDRVDLGEASKRNICVANAPDAVAESVADHVLALILAHYRNIVRGDKYVKEKKWRGPNPPWLIGHLLRGKRVGIVGMGRVGAGVAKRLRAFDAEVVYWDRRVKPEVEHALGVHWVDLDELVKTSDVVVVAVALTPETRKLINRERIYSMKRGALLVNTARGPIVDEEALIERLKAGEVYVALDVYDVEPLPDTSPLLELENTILTPHIAGFSWEALEETSVYIAQSIVNYIKHKSLPPTIVNKCTP